MSDANQVMLCQKIMRTLSHGDVFRITDLLRHKSAAYWWNPDTEGYPDSKVHGGQHGAQLGPTGPRCAPWNLLSGQLQGALALALLFAWINCWTKIELPAIWDYLMLMWRHWKVVGLCIYNCNRLFCLVVDALAEVKHYTVNAHGPFW